MTDQPKWYYSWANVARGPADVSSLRVLVAHGFVDAETLVWQEGWPHWQKLGKAGLDDVVGSPEGGSTEPPVLALPLPSDLRKFPPLPAEPELVEKQPAYVWTRWTVHALVFSGASLALAVSLVPLFRGFALTLSVPACLLALVLLQWTLFREGSKGFALLSVGLAFSAVGIGLWSYRLDNEPKASLTELLAIHDRGLPTPSP